MNYRKKQNDMVKKISLVVLAFIFFALIPSHAYSMENSSYILDLDSPDTKEAKPPEAPAAPPLEKGIIRGNGFTARLSYDDETKAVPFSLTASQETINFGEIKPGEPVIRSHSLFVPAFSYGSQILAYETHALRSIDKSEIPNASCDNGNCTNILPDVWLSPLTYGFGYRCDNITAEGCETNTNKDTYKRFSNLEVGETASFVLSQEGHETKSVVSYKLNIPGNQKEQGYQTDIYYIGVPNL